VPFRGNLGLGDISGAGSGAAAEPALPADEVETELTAELFAAALLVCGLLEARPLPEELLFEVLLVAKPGDAPPEEPPPQPLNIKKEAISNAGISLLREEIRNCMVEVLRSRQLNQPAFIVIVRTLSSTARELL